MKVKHILIGMAALVMLAPAVKGITSYAANTADSPYSFSLTTANTTPAYTEFRAKTDDSSIYVNPLAMTGSLSRVGVVVRARSELNGSISTVGLTGTKNYYYTIVGRGYRVHNLVKENGYSYASVGFYSQNGTGTASGVWSPDCANEGLYDEMPYRR
ncbi:MAG: hypothetical protein NC089_01520 [Bacteroides sp.]|nr:hypothetical protein [Bacteroides sp.]MCM1548802.1 hypothetical protein [Clostridium sp.]